MGFTYNGTEPTAVTYNGNEVQVITYNGVEVWAAEQPEDNATDQQWMKIYITADSNRPVRIYKGNGSQDQGNPYTLKSGSPIAGKGYFYLMGSSPKVNNYTYTSENKVTITIADLGEFTMVRRTNGGNGITSLNGLGQNVFYESLGGTFSGVDFRVDYDFFTRKITYRKSAYTSYDPIAEFDLPRWKSSMVLSIKGERSGDYAHSGIQSPNISFSSHI